MPVCIETITQWWACQDVIGMKAARQGYKKLSFVHVLHCLQAIALAE
jgi:hypothetical protein